MPNSLDSAGLTIQTQPEIVAEILDGAPEFPGMRAIYGPDINVDPNSPDGQMIAIIAQAKIDVLELVLAVYNSFDPDQATGAALNSRVAYNGIRRRAGTYTQQSITVTTDRALTLNGAASENAFTVTDSAGNKYVLIDTFNVPAAGVYALDFRATLLGAVQSLPNTINTIVSTLLGVVSVNNPAGPDEIGIPQETDYALRIRRQKAVQLPNQGYMGGLIAGLYNVDGVIEAKVYENDTDTTDANGIPSHSIWVIVDGGDDVKIAGAIYRKKNAGCGMKGSIVYYITDPNPPSVAIRFDRPTPQDLYLTFDLASTAGGSVDPDFVRSQILENITYGIGQQADVTTISAFVRSILPNAVVSDEGVSDDGVTYAPLIDTATIDKQFTLAAARIIINGVAG